MPHAEIRETIVKPEEGPSGARVETASTWFVAVLSQPSEADGVATLLVMEDVAFTAVMPRQDGDYGLFVRESGPWEIKLQPNQAEAIREGLPTALGGEYHLTLDTKDAHPL